MRGLNLRNQDLIPASLTMNSASGNALPIIGAALLRIRSDHSNRETRQMVYFSPLATKLYLSLATCTDLGLISMGFPLCMPTPPSGNGTGTWATPDQPLSQVHDLQTRNQDLQTRTQEPVTRPTRTPRPADLQARTQGPNPTPAVSKPVHTPHKPCSCPTWAPPLTDQPPCLSPALRPTVTDLNATCWTYTRQVRSTSVNTSPSP